MTIEQSKPAVTSVEEHGISIRNVDELFRFAKLVIGSGLAPASIKSPEQAMVAIQLGLEVGLKPMQALQNIAVINGKPAIYGDAGTSLVMGSGMLVGRKEHYEGQGDDFTAICELRRKGLADPIVGMFSIADAKKAGLLGKKGPWQDYPKRMLMWRARTYAYRDGFADCLAGMTFVEEARDIEPEPRPAEFHVQHERGKAAIALVLPAKARPAAPAPEPEAESDRESEPPEPAPPQHGDALFDEAEVPEF